MEAIIAWASAHPILAWSASGAAAVVILFVLWLIAAWIWSMWQSVDRSGARLTSESFTVTYDEDADEVVFTWTLGNDGKFAARKLHVGVTISTKQTNGIAGSWRLSRTITALEPGDRATPSIRVARNELIRQARDFDKGTVNLWSHYSSSRPNKAPNFWGAAGPHLHYKLAVGRMANADCVTIIDFTSSCRIKPY